MVLDFLKKKPEPQPQVKEQPKKIGRPRMYRDVEDEPVLDDSEEYETEGNGEEPETEEEPYETKVNRKVPGFVKPKTIVVRELPMQPVVRYKDKKTGEEVTFITIEEALTKILERLEE